MSYHSHEIACLKGARHLIVSCGSYKRSENLVVVFDKNTANLSKYFKRAAVELKANFKLIKLPAALMHGEEPPSEFLPDLVNADLLICLRENSMAHSKARILQAKNGGRFLSLPQFNINLLADPCVVVDYRKYFNTVRKLANELSSGTDLYITSVLGTNLHIKVDGRSANCCPGFVKDAGDLGSPPDIEANISPLEDGSNGVLVVDGSIPFEGFGMLRDPVKMKINAGKVVDISGNGITPRKLEKLFDGHGSEKTRILAEVGIGLNPFAKLSGVMLTDEGSLGTMHMGFGSNYTVGGLNDVSFHVDFVFKNPSLFIDDKMMIQNGMLMF
mgnify:FL=1